MKLKPIASRVVFTLLLLLPTMVVGETLNVVTTTPDLADLARQIGGQHVRVSSLTKGTEDFHSVRPRPRLLVKLSRADVLIEMGLDLEHSWLPALVKSSRNDKIKDGSKGLVNVSSGITALEIPDRISRKDGACLHPNGNPHCNLGPQCIGTIAGNVLQGLIANAPAHREDFEKAHATFMEKLAERIADWKRRLSRLKGAAFIEYHASWTYFAEQFGFRIVARLEPKPGISPSPKHLEEVIATGKAEKVGLVVARPTNLDLARKVANELGAEAVVLPLSSTAKGEFSGYLEYLEKVVTVFETYLKK